MSADRDDHGYFVSVDTGSAASSALADAQMELLRRSESEPRRLRPAWTRRAWAGIAAGLGLVLIVALLATGPSSAHAACTERVEGMAASLRGAGLSADDFEQQHGGEDPCAHLAR